MSDELIIKQAVASLLVEPHYLDYDYDIEDYEDDEEDEEDDEDLDKESDIDVDAFTPYKRRIKRMKRQRGQDRLKSRKYYMRHKPQVKRNQKRYRKRRTPQLKLRRKQGPHYRRIGEEADENSKVIKSGSFVFLNNRIIHLGIK